MELPAPPESSEVSIAVSRRPRHRTSTLFRDSAGEVWYLMGRIGLIVLLLMTAIILMVAAIVAAGYAFVFLVEHFANGP